MPLAGRIAGDRRDAHAVDRRAPSARDLVRSTFTVVLAGGRGERLKPLTDRCAKPAMPFAGQLKIVDFTLSNCVNSGLRRIAVMTQYKAQGLIRHVTQAWGFLDAGLGEFIEAVPPQQKIADHWYTGTADAVYQNLDMLQAADPKRVLVLAGDHVYRMDYGRIIAEHVRRDADVTVACVEVPLAQASAFGVVQTDAEGRIVAFDEKPACPCPMPGHPGIALVSMGVYVFSAPVLVRELCRDAAEPGSCHDFGAEILPQLLTRARVFAHDFADSCIEGCGAAAYWRDVGTLDAYWQAQMDLLGPCPSIDLYDDAWPLRGQTRHLPPAWFGPDDAGQGATLVDSIVAGGSIVSGATVRRSLLFGTVRVDACSTIDDALLLPGVQVGRHVVVKRAIVDSGCVLPDGIRIGLFPAEDAAYFARTDGGVTVVTPSMLSRFAQVGR
jgi:glucose-1-phosphate adenylyltransferase